MLQSGSEKAAGDIGNSESVLSGRGTLSSPISGGEVVMMVGSAYALGPLCWPFLSPCGWILGCVSSLYECPRRPLRHTH
jgi:hypothetical protein